MDIFEKIKKGVNQKTIWINTDGTGLMIAELFEKANIPINRFALSAKQFQPTPPPGFFAAFKASEKGWCFIKREAANKRVSKTGQTIIRVHADGKPRI